MALRARDYASVRGLKACRWRPAPCRHRPRTVGIQGHSADIKQRETAIAQTHAQRPQAVKEEKAKAVDQAAEIFKGLKARAESVRLQLTNRHKVEF